MCLKYRIPGHKERCSYAGSNSIWRIIFRLELSIGFRRKCSFKKKFSFQLDFYTMLITRFNCCYSTYFHINADIDCYYHDGCNFSTLIIISYTFIFPLIKNQPLLFLKANFQCKFLERNYTFLIKLLMWLLKCSKYIFKNKPESKNVSLKVRKFLKIFRFTYENFEIPELAKKFLFHVNNLKIISLYLWKITYYYILV